MRVTRRKFLQALGVAPMMTLCNAGMPQASEINKHHDRYVDHVPAIPVLMFYRIEEDPKFPEDISSDQLTKLFAHIWQQGYRPVNISDIIAGKVDAVVEKGFKPIGISTDGAHPSIIFSKNTAPNGGVGGPLNNTKSFVEIFGASLQGYALPRATFFLSMGTSKGSEDNTYFGSIMPLKDIADVLTPMPGIEFGYQTRWHTGLGGLKGAQVKAVIEYQMEHFKSLEMYERVQKIIAYPFGGRPTDEGMLALRNAQFFGGVLTYPGVGEAHYKQIPQCVYDGRLMTDSFLIPRVSIGSHVYAKGNKPLKNPPVNPIDDFKKDVEQAIIRPYISRGA